MKSHDRVALNLYFTKLYVEIICIAKTQDFLLHSDMFTIHHRKMHRMYQCDSVLAIINENRL